MILKKKRDTPKEKLSLPKNEYEIKRKKEDINFSIGSEYTEYRILLFKMKFLTEIQKPGLKIEKGAIKNVRYETNG